MPKLEPTADARRTSRTKQALAEAERDGLMLAAKVRTIAMTVVLVWVAIDHPGSGLSYLYDLGEVALFALLGGLQFIAARQRIFPATLKYVFVLIDCALLALVTGTLNPFDPEIIPPAILMNGSHFTYFFIILMQASFSLRPGLVLWCGVCIAAARALMLAWFIQQPGVFTNLDLPEQTVAAFLQARADPNFIYLGFVGVEILVALIVATGLAFVVSRSRQLVDSRSLAERSRASLARYFSPNVVDRLSNSEDPIGHAREQPAAVLFADIMGFTSLCEHQPPANVIHLLRDYHNRLGQAVFENAGTLDKYIGDGLMATFGTPEPGPNDAADALQCAIDMIASLERWNAERADLGQAPVHVGIGLHYGPVIAGDIGNDRRLEYSVIGDTVNIASRLEQLTRRLNTQLVASDNLLQAIEPASDQGKKLTARMIRAGGHQLKGREAPVTVWVLRDSNLVVGKS